MEVEAALRQLEAYQAQIAGALADARPILQNAEASCFKALALARWKLLRILREYQLFKHTEIFDPIIRETLGLKTATARLLKDRCIQAAEAYYFHVRRWSLEGPTGAWAEYASDALAICARIDEHLQRERRDVRALLVGMKSTRKAPADQRDRVPRRLPVTAHQTAFQI